MRLLLQPHIVEREREREGIHAPLTRRTGLFGSLASREEREGETERERWERERKMGEKERRERKKDGVGMLKTEAQIKTLGEVF
jgi:hypothetical protein